jgi:hypothetical protein
MKEKIKHQKNNEYYRKKCVTKAKWIARAMAKFTCEYCKEGEPEKRTHGSHIYSEGVNHGMSADLDNILCLCARHHATGQWNRTNGFNWHATPAEAMDWFRKKYPERARILRIRAQKPLKVDFKKRYYELCEIEKLYV